MAHLKKLVHILHKVLGKVWVCVRERERKCVKCMRERDYPHHFDKMKPSKKLGSNYWRSIA